MGSQDPRTSATSAKNYLPGDEEFVPVIKLKMKFFIAYAVVFGLLAFEEIQAEAKIQASAAATKPFAAEQNFNLLKQFENEDDDDYDDEEYYDEDDDDYYDDDDDDLDFGSGKIIPNLGMNFIKRNLYNYLL